MRVLFAVFAVVSSILAQPASSVLRPRASTGSRSTLVWSDDVIFPHLAFGGGWETQFVVVNMTNTSVPVQQKFFDPSGNAITVSYRSVPDGAVTTSTTAQFTLLPAGSYNIVLTDNGGGTVQTGWSQLVYDTTKYQLGGTAIFRQRVAGRPDFEAVVPLGAYDDPAFFIPFDNSSGYVTSMALANPDSALLHQILGDTNAATKTTAHLEFLDNQGNSIISAQTIDLQPGQQVAFAITDKYPDLAGKVGVLYVSGDTNFLSALGFRFNPGGAFATVPVMNWICMFQTCQ